MTSKIASSGSISHRLTAMGLLVTLGIVYGDIGTSPAVLSLYQKYNFQHCNHYEKLRK